MVLERYRELEAEKHIKTPSKPPPKHFQSTLDSFQYEKSYLDSATDFFLTVRGIKI